MTCDDHGSDTGDKLITNTNNDSRIYISLPSQISNFEMKISKASGIDLINHYIADIITLEVTFGTG